MQLLRLFYYTGGSNNMGMNQEILELGQGRIAKLLIKFSFPCVLGLLISAFYNIVDQIFIGNSELGYLGNAATGVSFPVICIANAIAAPAVEFKTEGFILGVGAKMFTIAGPVIVYGVSASVIYGFIYWLTTIF